MKRAVIVDCVRTPIGRAHKDKGVFREVRSDDLAVQVVQALIERTGVDRAEIEDVVMGNTQQQGEQGLNAARVVGIMAGLATHTGGTTVNRLCGSALQAINQAAHAIMAGFEDVQIVGGLEHMQHIPMDAGINLNPKLFHRTSKGALSMGVTAEFLAYSASRGNDLSTPRPEYRFRGLKPGDRWCLCALRWREALVAGMAPLVVLESTHERALDFVSLQALQARALDAVG